MNEGVEQNLHFEKKEIVMGSDELKEIIKELPVADKVVKATERDIDKIRQKKHLPEPTGKENESERKEGYNEHYLEKMEEVLSDPEASEFVGFMSEFPARIEKIFAEIFREGSRFEDLHPKDAIVLRHIFAIYEEDKRFNQKNVAQDNVEETPAH